MYDIQGAAPSLGPVAHVTTPYYSHWFYGVPAPAPAEAAGLLLQPLVDTHVY